MKMEGYEMYLERKKRRSILQKIDDREGQN